jgi:hypothetical protein
MNNFDIPTKVSVRNNRLVIRQAFEEFRTHKEKSALQLKNEDNLKFNVPSGLVTRKVRLKMQRIIGCFIMALQNSPVNDNGYRLYMPTFVTLTLPALQFHTDKELHKQALNRFLITVKRKFGVVNYLWRCERQKNGNLHYHILIDKYIHHSAIREVWNTIMLDLGYINAYRNNQLDFHKNGFKMNYSLSDKWTYERQLDAYNNGVATNWANPNSTDIHSLKNIDNVEDYICKYATKCEEYNNLEMLNKALHSGTIEQTEYDNYK